jgi:hypothetical protein
VLLQSLTPSSSKSMYVGIRHSTSGRRGFLADPVRDILNDRHSQPDDLSAVLDQRQADPDLQRRVRHSRASTVVVGCGSFGERS